MTKNDLESSSTILYFDRSKNDFNRRAFHNGELYDSLASELKVERNVAKTVFYMRVFDATAKKIGETLINLSNKGSYADSGISQENPYSLAIEKLGEEAIKIIDLHLIEAYKITVKELSKIDEKDVDTSNNISYNGNVIEIPN